MKKAHKLRRLSKSLLDKPQLITPEKFSEIAEVLENRDKNFSSYFDDDEVEVEELDSKLPASFGVLRIEGPTTYKKTGWEAYCGGCSYVGLLEQMNDFVAKGKTTVLMKIDSGGGQAYRMMFSARELRRLADENGIKIIAYVDGMCASAAMGLACAAHEIVSNPEAEIGSVGVVISLLDQSKALEDAGLKRIFITAGGEKVPYAEDGSFRDTFLKSLKDDVDKLYDKFTTHVATTRNIPVENVIATEARVFDAEEAKQIGFIDSIMEETEFYDYLNLENIVDTKQDEPYKDNGDDQSDLKTTPKGDTLMSKDTKVAEMAAPTLSAEETAANLAALTQANAKLAAMETKLAEFEAKELAAATETLSAKLDSTSFLAESKEPLMSFFMSADVNDENKALMNSVIASANTEMAAKEASHKEELTAAKAEAGAALEAATTEAKEAKELAAATTKNFGEKEESDESVPVIEAHASTKERYAALVAQRKSNK